MEPRLRKEYSYTSTPSLDHRDLIWDDLYLTSYKRKDNLRKVMNKKYSMEKKPTRCHFVLSFISPLQVAQHVSGNHVPIFRS